MTTIVTAIAVLLCGVASTSAATTTLGPDDWPRWRGPSENGIAAPNQTPPITWSETENIHWKVALPGKGHASPTVVGDFIYLPTADDEQEVQSVLCLRRDTGERVWTTTVHQGRFDRAGNERKSHASPSISCDGERLFVSFVNDGAVRTSALNANGKILWQRKVSDFVTHQGYGATPYVYQSLVIVAADHKGGGAIAAYDRSTGRQVWRNPRPAKANYVSPIVHHLDGRDQLLLSGCNLVSSFAPLTGETLWEFPGSTTEVVVTIVTDGKRIFSSGGYPKNHTMGMLADGSGEIAWQNTARGYVPSMIVREDHLYAVLDAGFAVCWNAATGEERWKERLGGDFFATPVFAGEHFYATNVRGTTYVFEGSPTHFELIASNKLGDETYASPVICGSQIFLRSATVEDNRQEFLYCIGERRGPTL